MSALRKPIKKNVWSSLHTTTPPDPDDKKKRLISQPGPPKKLEFFIWPRHVFCPSLTKAFLPFLPQYNPFFLQRYCSKWGWMPREQQSRGWWQSAEMSQPKEQVCVCICIWRWIHRNVSYSDYQVKPALFSSLLRSIKDFVSGPSAQGHHPATTWSKISTVLGWNKIFRVQK